MDEPRLTIVSETQMTWTPWALATVRYRRDDGQDWVVQVPYGTVETMALLPQGSVMIVPSLPHPVKISVLGDRFILEQQGLEPLCITWEEYQKEWL